MACKEKNEKFDRLKLIEVESQKKTKLLFDENGDLVLFQIRNKARQKWLRRKLIGLYGR